MIIDAHLHRRDLPRSAYSWITPELGPLHRTIPAERVRAPRRLEDPAVAEVPDEQGKILAGTAVRGYRLGSVQQPTDPTEAPC
jgi:hypothetical protein